jgi:hypothetical protein
VGNDPVPVGVRTNVLADLAGPGHLFSGGARKVHGLNEDLVRLSWACSNWAHVQ